MNDTTTRNRAHARVGAAATAAFVALLLLGLVHSSADATTSTPEPAKQATPQQATPQQATPPSASGGGAGSEGFRFHHRDGGGAPGGGAWGGGGSSAPAQPSAPSTDGSTT